MWARTAAARRLAHYFGFVDVDSKTVVRESLVQHIKYVLRLLLRLGKESYIISIHQAPHTHLIVHIVICIPIVSDPVLEAATCMW